MPSAEVGARPDRHRRRVRSTRWTCSSSRPGSQTTDFLAPMEVAGRGGSDLNETWRDGAEAYLGMTVAGFPNIFMLYGPNTNLGVGSIVCMLESQIRYVARVRSRRCGGRGARYIDVRPPRSSASTTRSSRSASPTASGPAAARTGT